MVAAAMRRSIAEGPSLRNVCLLALALRLALFLAPGLQGIAQVLERRPELGTPVSSYMAFKEALHLQWLHASSGDRLPKPYASGTLHLPPVMLLVARLWQPFVSETHQTRIADEALHIATATVWSLVDVAAGAVLASAYRRKQALAKHNRHTATGAAANLVPNVDGVVLAGSLFASPGGVAACYLFNPLTLAGCLARSTGPFNNLAVFFTVNAAMAASPLLMALGLSAAALISLYPGLLAPACLLLCSMATATYARRQRGQSAKVYPLGRLISYTVVLAAALAAGVYLSFHAADRDWSFLERAYGTILLVPDLTPNIGLWWYFFIEIFDHFRDFFLLAFNVHAACYALPLAIKYQQDPLFAITALSGLTAALKSYPTLSDAALFLALLSLHTEILPYLRHPFVTALLYTVSSLLMPALHHVWLSAGSGNANFFYASTLVWAIGSGAAVLDTMWAWGRWRWEAERPPVTLASKHRVDRKQDVLVTRRVVQM